MAFRLDIKEVLRRLDRRDFDWFASLSDEERKSFAGPPVLRWMSAVANDQQELMLLMVNEVANKHFYALYEHPELQYKLLASCGLGVTQRHEWIPNAKSAVSARTLVQEFLQELHPSANDFELDILFGGMTRDDLELLTQDCALAPDRTKAILNAFDKTAKL